MGNPQERFYGWLAGIVDGEGTISIQCYNLPNKNIRLTPFISITNTDEKILNECMRIIDLMDLVGKKNIRKMWRDAGTNRDCYHIRMDGRLAVKSFLNVIQDYLVGKREQSDLVLAFIDNREKNLFKQDGLGRLRRRPYNPEDVRIVEALRFLHRRKSPTTLRTAPNVELG